MFRRELLSAHLMESSKLGFSRKRRLQPDFCHPFLDRTLTKYAFTYEGRKLQRKGNETLVSRCLLSARDQFRGERKEKEWFGRRGTRERRQKRAVVVGAAGDSVFGIFESARKTDVSIGGAERPWWSTMASNRIYIPGELVFTPANHPGFRPRYEGD